MVMPNRHEEPGWWDDLPPLVRSRFAAAPPESTAETGEFQPIARMPAAAEPNNPASLDWLRDLSRLAVLFLAVAIANVVFLILALAFVDGPATMNPFQSR